MAKIKIKYSPRPYQVLLHKELDEHRFSVVVCHRRFGKTVTSVIHIIKHALECKKDRPQFAYLAPFRNQAKNISWMYFKKYLENVPGVSYNENELKITLPNKAIIMVVGADNPDALRGMYFDGVIMDEVAQMKPEVWSEVIRPTLADRRGWAVFIGTPKGVNLFSDLYFSAVKKMAEFGEKSEWYATKKNVFETTALPPREIESARNEMSDNSFRQEFMCDFDASSDDTLITLDDVQVASSRMYKEHRYVFAPIVLGVDVARFGVDASVIFRRQGNVAFPPIVLHNLDTVDLGNRIAREIEEFKPEAVFIDAGGGGGVIDYLQRLNYRMVQEVSFGSRAIQSERYANRRAEMWCEMADWIKKSGALPNSSVGKTSAKLAEDLCAPTYFINRSNKKQLESKDDMKKRLGRSPDMADALALTFAMPLGMTSRKRRTLGVLDEEEKKREPFDPFKAFDLEFKKW